MSAILPTSGYGRKKETIHRVRFATQDKRRKPLIFCPRRCTQKRTRRNRLKEKRTFDPKIGLCHNCYFRQINAVKPIYFKASDFIQKGNL